MRRQLVLLITFAVACGDSETPDLSTVINMRFDRASSFYDAPWPSDDLLDAAGRLHLAGFPNPGSRPVVRDAVAVLEESAHGFALAGAIFFPAGGPLDPARLPSLADSTTAGS